MPRQRVIQSRRGQGSRPCRSSYNCLHNIFQHIAQYIDWSRLWFNIRYNKLYCNLLWTVLDLCFVYVYLSYNFMFISENKFHSFIQWILCLIIGYKNMYMIYTNHIHSCFGNQYIVRNVWRWSSCHRHYTSIFSSVNETNNSSPNQINKQFSRTMLQNIQL
jgi:hypothetical protein